MKKHIYLFLLFSFILALTACAEKTEAPVAMLAKAAPENADQTQNLYTNQELSFSFAIPDSWETENYEPVVSSAKLPDGTTYKKADFVFQNDKDNPLLSIMLLPKAWWDKNQKNSQYLYLGTKESIAYCCSLPLSCPYEVGTKADLYNSMALVKEDVPKRFTILESTSSSNVPAFAQSTKQSVIVQADTAN
jgi:hypothetical protein